MLAVLQAENNQPFSAKNGSSNGNRNQVDEDAMFEKLLFMCVLVSSLPYKHHHVCLINPYV